MGPRAAALQMGIEIRISCSPAVSSDLRNLTRRSRRCLVLAGSSDGRFTPEALECVWKRFLDRWIQMPCTGSVEFNPDGRRGSRHVEAILARGGKCDGSRELSLDSALDQDERSVSGTRPPTVRFARSAANSGHSVGYGSIGGLSASPFPDRARRTCLKHAPSKGDRQEITYQGHAPGLTNPTCERGDRRCHALASATVPRLRRVRKPRQTGEFMGSVSDLPRSRFRCDRSEPIDPWVSFDPPVA